MGLQTCIEHGPCLVVFDDALYCPVCEKIENLEGEMEVMDEGPP